MMLSLGTERELKWVFVGKKYEDVRVAVDV